jgi:hypothetical protein
MIEKSDMKKIEKNIYSALFNDGSIDILIGLWILGMGLSILLADLGFSISEEIMLFTVPPAFVVYIFLVIFVTNPRKGIMKLSEEKQRSKTKFGLIQTIWLILALIVGIYFSIQPINANIWNDVSVSLFWITGSIILFSIMAFSLKVDRFYIYGLLAAITFPFRVFTKNIFFEISTSMFIIVSLIILVWGIVILTQFIKNTPKVGKL